MFLSFEKSPCSEMHMSKRNQGEVAAAKMVPATVCQGADVWYRMKSCRKHHFNPQQAARKKKVDCLSRQQLTATGGK